MRLRCEIKVVVNKSSIRAHGIDMFYSEEQNEEETLEIESIEINKKYGVQKRILTNINFSISLTII